MKLPVRQRGWVFYDASCRICRHGAARFGPTLISRGFWLAPLQSRRGRRMVRQEVDEMKVVTLSGEVFGGAEGVAYLSRFVWWALPLAWLWRWHAMRPVMERAYRWIADHRHCRGGACSLRESQWDFDRWF